MSATRCSTKRVPLLGLLCAGLLSLTACAGSGEKVEPPPAPAPTASPSGVADFGHVVTDTELDTTITFLRVVRGLTPPAEARALARREMVFVEVRVDAGRNYSNPLSEKEFLFGTAGGTTSPAAERGPELDALMKAGHHRLGVVPSGTSGTGWIVGTVAPASSTKALVAYRRMGGITDKGVEIPGKTWRFPLPRLS